MATERTAPYEDNYGFYRCDDDPDELAFFEYVKSQSVVTKCARCGEPVRLLPTKTLCARCAEAIEFGG